MKTYSYRSRSALVLMTACLLLSNGHAVRGSDVHSRQAATVAFAFVQPVTDPARLIIRRIPNLGNQVVVNLYVDGVATAGIGYGRSYETFLRPGRHVLSVRTTPHAKWLLPWDTILDVRDGQTYSFTAKGNHSGNLILSQD